jgi:hypothetical protein
VKKLISFTFPLGCASMHDTYLTVCIAFIFQVSQELNITERDPNYLNPYSKIHKQKHNKQQSPEQNTVKKKRKKEHKKGPRMSSGTFTREL